MIYNSRAWLSDTCDTEGTVIAKRPESPVVSAPHGLLGYQDLEEGTVLRPFPLPEMEVSGWILLGTFGNSAKQLKES